MNPYEPPNSFQEVQLDETVPFDRFEVLEFVHSSLQMLPVVAEHREQHVTGLEICQVVLQLAYDLSGSSELAAISFLKQMQLTNSRLVGEAIYELIELGYCKASEDDSLEEFAGVFDIEIPIPQWKCAWSDAPTL